MPARGLVKAKKYEWLGSNVELIGSASDHAVKKEAAKCEPAWQNAGKETGVQIWRVEKFSIKPWPLDKYGQFYSGDSYIILYTYKDEATDKKLHDVHFWLGKFTTQDEAGTAAYKTVELDDFLDGVPVQYRECQGHESDKFKSYFPKGITTMEGGCDSGFNPVAPEEYECRLLHVCKSKEGPITVREIARCPTLINEDDVFILDCGLMICQYNGSNSSPMERSKAMQYVRDLKLKRGDADSEVLDGGSVPKSHPFWEKLDEDEDGDNSDDEDCDGEKKLLRVNTDTKESVVVKEGDIKRADLASDDVFIFDAGEKVFVWIGEKASPLEKKNGISYAHNYLNSSGCPWRHLAVLREGQHCDEFEAALAA